VPLGRIDARAGQGAAACIARAVDLVKTGAADAIVTAPIHKEALAAAGIVHPGHTEMLQELAAIGGRMPAVRMMLANDELRTVLVTIHQSLRSAIEAVTFDAVSRRSGSRTGPAAGLGPADAAHRGRRPQSACGGGRPVRQRGGDDHRPGDRRGAGRGHRRPRVRMHRTPSSCAPATSPASGEFDIVIAMTHDHGLIPVKYLGVENGVNVTLGLPFVRTSPDHGTAFDIAGRGIADPVEPAGGGADGAPPCGSGARRLVAARRLQVASCLRARWVARSIR
jgi:4-hydroxythreonine-4-phosphate dehydrogenase